SKKSVLRNIFDHPITPIILGLGVILEGPHDLQIRMGTLCVLGGWLVYDTWQWLKKREWQRQWKHIVIASVFEVTFILIIGIMYETLKIRLDQQEEDVFNHLTAEMYFPPSRDLTKSIVTFTNGGKETIGRHGIVCRINNYTSDVGGTAERIDEIMSA